MQPARWVIAALFAVVLGLPMVMSRCSSSSRAPAADGDLPKIIVVSPHVPQIREEFGRAFSAWHEREHGTGVRVDFRTIGGTSEIIRALEARYRAAMGSGEYSLVDGEVVMEPGTIEFDLMFGGGTYDHGRLKSGITFQPTEGVELEVPMSVPAGFSQDRLDAWYGENRVGAGKLYDDEQYWIGNAMSGFGIVYNRDLMRELLGRDDLSSFEDLTDPRLAGWVALADPRQSGSITTSMDAILSGFGWEDGWRTLRAMSANTRYFTNSSSKPPIDVSQGEAAAGLAIDFYGRTQSQVVMREGETPETARVGYVDPAGEVSIDADPASLLRGGPNPEMARRFIEFTLTDEGQALWNFPATGDAGGDDNPRTDAGEKLGPARFELRRMPIRREFYRLYSHHLIDKVDPYSVASSTPPAGWRSAIGMMMGAFAVDNHHAIAEAWGSLVAARERGVDVETLAEAEDAFFAFPTPEQVERLWRELFGRDEPVVPADALQPFTPENYRTIRNTWRDPSIESRLSIVYTRAFAENYRHVTELLDDASRHTDANP